MTHQIGPRKLSSDAAEYAACSWPSIETCYGLKLSDHLLVYLTWIYQYIYMVGYTINEVLYKFG